MLRQLLDDAAAPASHRRARCGRSAAAESRCERVDALSFGLAGLAKGHSSTLPVDLSR